MVKFDWLSIKTTIKIKKNTNLTQDFEFWKIKTQETKKKSKNHRKREKAIESKYFEMDWKTDCRDDVVVTRFELVGDMLIENGEGVDETGQIVIATDLNRDHLKKMNKFLYQ